MVKLMRLLLKPAFYKAAFMVMLCGSPAAAQGRPDTGNGLYEDCKNDNLTWSDGYCAGRIQGITTGMTAASILYDRKLPWCTRENVTNGQIRDVVVAWLRNNPAERDLLSAIVVIKALRAAYPCS